MRIFKGSAVRCKISYVMGIIITALVCFAAGMLTGGLMYSWRITMYISHPIDGKL